MRLLAISAVLAAVAVGQWSEPVTLAESISAYGSGPDLVPVQGDTVWVFWIHEDVPPVDRLTARCFAGDTWGEPELLAVGPEGIFWPAGVVDDSGRMLVAYYEGSYPVKSPADQDSWGIYTVTRTDTVWTRPQLAHEMMMGERLPFDIRLGHDRWGGIGMVWEEGPGGAIHVGSVMFSRKTSQGWTPRRCLAAGSEDISYGTASLIPGDTTDFYLAFTGAGLQPPYPCTVQVWTLNDTLVVGPTRFAGRSGRLARSEERRCLVYGRGDTLFGSVNRGSGWETPVVIGTGLGYRGPTLAVDALGWAWVSWTDSAGQVVLASHNAGCYWSSPETVALCQDGSNPQIASDEYGRIHCCWLAAGTGGLASVRWAYRLTRPGVEEKAKDDRRTQNRGAAVMRRLPAGAVAFDAMGRRVLNPKSGVYFVRAVSGKPSAVSCHKVVIQR